MNDSSEPATLEPPTLRPEIRQIIAQGAAPQLERCGSSRPVAVLTAASMLLLWLSFTPIDWSFLAWVSLVPLSQLLRLKSLSLRSYAAVYCVAFVWAVATLQWMRLGHPTMYLALVTLAFYVAMYVPAFVWLGRRCVFAGTPIWLTIPVVWTALEYIRSWLFTGFAWYFLGHTQYRWPMLIQICDVTGVCGVTFIVALVSGAIAVNVPVSWLRRLNLEIEPDPALAKVHSILWTPVVCALVGVAACLTYGAIRRIPPEQFPPGPVFALIQGNFTPEVKHDPREHITRYRVHDSLTREAVRLQPDFIVWPETMFPSADRSVADGVSDKELLANMPREVLQHYGNETEVLVDEWRSGEVRQRLEMHAQASGAALIIGMEAIIAEKDRLKAYNGAAFVRPDIGYIGRYDKIHRVVFGEYIPLNGIFPWLHNLTPFGANYGIEAGDAVRMFEYGGHRIAPLICFEDTVPQVVRQIASQRDSAGNPCDVLVNLTNDAWFHGSSQLDQHLITAAFRCVELRMPMVRCVNGGISAFIDGNGQIREPADIFVMSEPFDGLQLNLKPVKGMRDPETGAWRRQFSGIIFGQAPLDPRDSWYVRFGDWFSQLCLAATIVLIGISWVRSKSAANA